MPPRPVEVWLCLRLHSCVRRELRIEFRGRGRGRADLCVHPLLPYMAALAKNVRPEAHHSHTYLPIESWAFKPASSTGLRLLLSRRHVHALAHANAHPAAFSLVVCFCFCSFFGWLVFFFCFFVCFLCWSELGEALLYSSQLAEGFPKVGNHHLSVLCTLHEASNLPSGDPCLPIPRLPHVRTATGFQLPGLRAGSWGFQSLWGWKPGDPY